MPTNFDKILEEGPTRNQSIFATTDTGACWDFHYAGAYSYSYNARDSLIRLTYANGNQVENIYYDAGRIIRISVATNLQGLTEEGED